MEEPVLEGPAQTYPGYDAVKKAIWDKELKDFVKRSRVFEENLVTVQAVIPG